MLLLPVAMPEVLQAAVKVKLASAASRVGGAYLFQPQVEGTPNATCRLRVYEHGRELEGPLRGSVRVEAGGRYAFTPPESSSSRTFTLRFEAEADPGAFVTTELAVPAAASLTHGFGKETLDLLRQLRLALGEPEVGSGATKPAVPGLKLKAGCGGPHLDLRNHLEKTHELPATAANLILDYQERHPIDSSLYGREGLAQPDEMQKRFGLRADVALPAGHVCAALEEQEHKEGSWFRTHEAEDEFAFPAINGYGDCVNVATPLLDALLEDVRQRRTAPIVLDLGAGVGFGTSALLKAGAIVVANDLDARHLAMVKVTTDPPLRERLHLRDGAITTLDFPGDSVDGILCSYVLHYLRPEEIQATFARCAGWLKPGGRIYLQAFNRKHTLFDPFTKTLEDQAAAGLPWPGALHDTHRLAEATLTGAELADFREENWPGFLHAIDRQEIRAALEQAGFRMVSMTTGFFHGDVGPDGDQEMFIFEKAPSGPAAPPATL